MCEKCDLHNEGYTKTNVYVYVYSMHIYCLIIFYWFKCECNSWRKVFKIRVLE